MCNFPSCSLLIRHPSTIGNSCLFFGEMELITFRIVSMSFFFLQSCYCRYRCSLRFPTSDDIVRSKLFIAPVVLAFILLYNSTLLLVTLRPSLIYISLFIKLLLLFVMLLFFVLTIHTLATIYNRNVILNRIHY